MPQQELAQAMFRPQLVFLSCLPGSYQISQGLMGRIRYPHRRQLSGPIISRQLQRIASIGLHPFARFHRCQPGCHHLALRPQGRQLPVHDIPRWARFITEPQLLHGSQFLDQLPNRLLPIRNDSKRSHFPARPARQPPPQSFRHGHPNQQILFFSSTGSFACGSVLLVFRFAA
jgi:hypothetical protein